MISCRTLARMLLDFVGKELLTEHRELVEEHLAVCACCRAFEDTYRAVICLAHQLPPVPLPPRLLQFLRDNVSGTGTR